jgi:hypothetical protein
MTKVDVTHRSQKICAMPHTLAWCGHIRPRDSKRSIAPLGCPHRLGMVQHRELSTSCSRQHCFRLNTVILQHRHNRATPKYSISTAIHFNTIRTEAAPCYMLLKPKRLQHPAHKRRSGATAGSAIHILAVPVCH